MGVGSEVGDPGQGRLTFSSNIGLSKGAGGAEVNQDRGHLAGRVVDVDIEGERHSWVVQIRYRQIEETLSFDAVVTPGYGFDVVELSDELARLFRSCHGGVLRKQPPEGVRVLIGEQLVVGGLVSRPVPCVLSRCPDQVLARVVCVGRALLARWTVATGVAAVKV